MPNIDLVTRFILSFLNLISTIYISSYSMENINHYSFMSLSTWYQSNDPNISLSLLSNRRFPSPHSRIPLFLTPTSASSSPCSTYIMAQEQQKITVLLIMLHLSLSSTYPIKTLSNSHQQTTSPRSFRLKLSLSATTSINLSIALTLVHRPRLAPSTRTRKIQLSPLDSTRQIDLRCSYRLYLYSVDSLDSTILHLP